MGDIDFNGPDRQPLTRRQMLLGTAGAIGAAAVLAAGGTGAAAGTGNRAARRAAVRAAAARPRSSGDVGSTLTDLLGIEADSAGADQSIELGAVLALTGPGSFYGKTMSRGLDLAAKHIKAAGGPEFKYIYLDHKSGDAAAGQQAMSELSSKGVQAKFASYVDDLGAMLSATAEQKMFTLDGGGGTSIFGQGQPYFWGTRAVTPNDPMPGLFQWLKETYPDKKTVGLVGWDIGEPNNTTVKKDILAKIEASGLEFNDLYELVPVGGQDFSQVIPKITDNEPDVLLASLYGQDPGSFYDQATTAGVSSVIVGFEFTPDGLNASKGSYDSVGYTFAYDYFDAQNAPSPFAKLFVEEFNNEYGEDPDFYAANFYENAFVMWELMRRIWSDGESDITGTALDDALRTDLTVVSVYGGDESTVGSYTLNEETHSVEKRPMGVFEYKGGEVTPKAFFDIDGADFKMA